MDAELAAFALPALRATLAAQEPGRLRLVGDSEVILPRAALGALARILESFAQGEGATLLPSRAELTILGDEQTSKLVL